MPRSRASVVFFSLAVALCASPRAWADAPGSPERISANDNRAAAGALEGTTLTLRLEAREGEWLPDGDTDPGIPVRAFGVEGQPLQIPGPLIRVREGTEVRAFVRNRLDAQPLVVHGLAGRTPRPGAWDAVTVNAGDVREIRFVASTPGTYYYWGATSDVPLAQRTAKDTQLSGAFIVEPRGIAPLDDRIFVIGVWPEAGPNGVIAPGTLIRMVMNGKSWPHTERLTYTVGDTVHIRVISPGSAVHPMHLHGSYFNVDSRGDGETDTIYPPNGSPHLVNTERLAPGRTMTFTWVPTTPGNWLFHCHDTAHIAAALPIDGTPAAPSHHVANHALEMMSGPVVGITVRPKPGSDVATEATNRRALRLVARVNAGGTPQEPAYGFTLEDGKTTTPAAPPDQPNPVIVLRRGEPVSITVVNDLPEATAIHWHGIELESYYDGVAGFAGDAARIAPAIEPGASFEARFTPPRSGTFIYHTHVDEMRQQQAGLNGALLVVDDPARYDPAHDIVLVVSVPRRAADSNVVLINGSLTPSPLEMKAGERYRLRFIDIHVFRPSMRMRLLGAEGLLTWRSVAKDGMDLPADQAIAGPSQIQMGNGETYDFEFVPDTAGELRVDVETATGVLLARLPIHVR
jgi:manganese oxidase